MVSGGYRALNLPIIVLACKADLPRRIEPDRALDVLTKYDVGLVEVTTAHDTGKGKMRQSFDWLVKAIFRARGEHAANLWPRNVGLRLYHSIASERQ